MELSLQLEEARLLQQVLARYLSDLRMEIAGTEAYVMRQEMKRDEELIKVMLVRLEATLPAE